MTVHVISVGLSLLESLAHPQALLADKPDLVSVIRRERPQELLAEFHPNDKTGASDWLERALAPAAEHAPDSGPHATLAALTQSVKPGLWPARASAELDTFTRVPATSYPLATDDVAVLVCSDTQAGLAAGVWNAVALAGGAQDRVRYLADPKSPPGKVRGCALVVRVPGMDAGNDEGFRQAMGGLGALGHHLRQSGEVPEGEPFRFYLSGGFKAAIPYLIGLAEGLSSLPGTGPVSAWVLHETYALHESELKQQPIRLPLRRMAQRRIQEELRGLSEDHASTTPPPSDFLNGYAYEKTSDGWRLTAFGVGLKALFGIPPPGLGT